MEGFLLIDKPAGITSHGVVARVRRITKVKRVGHSGTLDPFATGLLIVGVGRGATKRLGEFLGSKKTYEALAVFGATSDTQDKDGLITPFQDAVEPSPEDIEATLPAFRGEITQVPPMFSAKKIEGKKLYELAREGKVVERDPVPVTIHELETVDLEGGKWRFRVTGSSGTYVRTLAHDIGQSLKCGAYLEELRRTAIGEVGIAGAIKLDDLTPENWEEHLRSI